MTRKVESVSGAPFPVRLTSFVGRVAELRSVSDALGRHRLVALVGPGGSGKTRLALEAARGWSGERRWFVDLAPVDGDGVDAALAVATDAPEGPGEAPLDATVRRIGGAPALLVLDNCDQVVASCARAVDGLLQACPGLTVLATSRAPLRVEGEQVWRVPPLSLPANGDSLDGDAVLLFLDRASLSTDAATRDLEQIHEICRHLDGMPLAIELAASRATVLSVTDILTGLTDRFRLLTGGPRTADMRQQSLAESIDWSYRLLADGEATVLERLAVFRAPFTAEAARAVAAGQGIDDRNVLPLLADLVEKSFVVIDERHDVPRYRLLETIREYAAARLERQPEQARAVKDRHLVYHREFAERVEPESDSPSIAHWAQQLEAELPDVRSALSWAAATGNADDALRLVGAMGYFFWGRARGEGRGIIETALAITGGQARWRAKAYISACQAAFARFEPDGIGLGEEAVRIAREAGDPSVLARALLQLGWMVLLVDLPHAEPYLRQARELARQADDEWSLIGASTVLALAAIREPVAARAQGEEVLRLALDNDRPLAATHARLALGSVNLMQGRLAGAQLTWTEVLRMGERIRETSFVTSAHFALTVVAVFRGQDDLAATHVRAAEETARASGNPLSHGLAAGAAGWRWFGLAELASMRAALTTALPVMSMHLHGLLAPQLAGLRTEAALAAGDADGAREHATQTAELAERAGYDWGRSHAALAKCRIHLHDGEIQAAAESAHHALELAQRHEDAITTIDALDLLARIAAERRALELAVRLLGAAAAERARIGYALFRVHTAAHDSLSHDLERQLGAEEFATTWAEGERLTVDAAVALARSRRGSRGRPATGWDALTPAELRVVELVGEGLNNIQIAERLFITRDTVKGHVSAAFRKLGVGNRIELAAEAARRALS